MNEISSTSPNVVSSVPKKRQRDIMEILKHCLNILDYKLDENFNFYKVDENGLPLPSQSIDSITTNILNFKASAEFSIDLSKQEIMDNLIEYQKYCRTQDFIELRRKMKYDKSAISHMENLVETICGTKNYNKLFPILFRQIFSVMKKRLYELDVEYPLFMNISGQHNCGKGYFVKRMISSLIPGGLYEEVKDLSQKVNNFEKNGYLFSDRYAIIFGELSNAAKADISILKDIVDSKTSAYRLYHTQSSRIDRNRAQLIGTSNEHLREIFPRDKHIRKYFNIEYAPHKTEEEKLIRWSIIENFDYMNEMKCIDEKEEEPIIKVYAEYLDWVMKDCYSPTQTDYWVSAFLYNNRGKTLMFGEIYDEYELCEMIKPKITKQQLFRDVLLRYGAVPLKRKTDGTPYEIPHSLPEPLLGSEIYYDGNETTKTMSNWENVKKERKKMYD